MLRSRTGRVFVGLVGLVALGVVVGGAILWPSHEERRADLGPALAQAKAERAEVLSITERRCSGFQTSTCRDVRIELLSGRDEGFATTIRLGTGGLDPDLEVGDELRVARNEVPPGTTAEQTDIYSLVDFERRLPLAYLAAVFAVLVVLLGRLRGALSLVGLVLSLAIVVAFVIPALLEGEAAVPVAFVGALAVMLVTIPLAHGVGPKSVAAILGTTGALAVTLGLAVLWTEVANITGFANEDATLLRANESPVSLSGLVVAGMVIGALGVLDDVTVSQASTVMALRGANRSLGVGELFGRAMAVGRDHVSATVNTLVLAYAGASLPILLIFGSTEIGIIDAINGELVATEVIAMLVGSIGLICAVPITTLLAAYLSTRLDPEVAAADAEHGHAH